MKRQKDDMQVNVAGIRRNIKNLAHNYSDPQVKVREATSNDPWGPSATIMAEIADLTYNVVAFSEIMQMIWKRLNDHGKNWRHVYKALILLEYLIKTGTEKVAQQCKENIYAIQTLKEFQYFEEGKDQGLHVREKAKTLVSLLKDDERLKNERTKALKAKERFAQHASGFGSDGSIDGPTPLSHRDSPSWRTESEASRSASELEYVRPQTVGEEELQLQLAMAMSREEAEQEEAKRRSDDVRLQLALSQSEQDFKKNTNDPHAKPQPNQSHLMDLLDISLGATSISGPSQSSDPWGMPMAEKQTSDPWSRVSPATDPWNTNTGAISRQPMPSIASAGVTDTWVARNHSPSVASGSSNEGWLQNNAATANGNGNVNASQLSDPWLSKPSIKSEQPDPWLNKTTDTNNDAWQPASKSGVVDPWAPASSNIGSRPSPIGAQTSPNSDYDEFDVISNRAKTQNTNSNNNINNNNNNTSNALLDDMMMDPLAASKNTSTRKTPQSFLGENSALVNLDQLIKTSNPTNPGQAAAFSNPFGDLAQPPKTNLFQQQMQPVPSINQLKQSPFPVCISQDPWAPVNNSSQYVATNADEHTQEVHEYDENENYDDVFDTKHVEDIQINTNTTYNNNYKIYFDDEYHDFNQISQICVDTERNNITNNNRNNTTGNNTNNNNNTAAPWLNPEVAASNPFLS